MISEERVHKALSYLSESAGPAAQARAERVYLEEFTRSLRAVIMAEHLDKPLGAQEREAYADQRYATHLKGLKAAVEADEFHRFKRAAEAAIQEAWRTQCSNERAMKL